MAMQAFADDKFDEWLEAPLAERGGATLLENGDAALNVSKIAALAVGATVLWVFWLLCRRAAPAREAQQQNGRTRQRQVVHAPFPRKRDGRFGRRWKVLGPRIHARTVLSSEAFLVWLDTPLWRGRGGAVLEDGNIQGTRKERQFVLDARDAHRFKGGAKYSSLAFDGVGMPDEFRDALLYVQGAVASSEFGADWERSVRPLSIQVTWMDPDEDRGDHNDFRGQGTFIGSYTARGSGEVRVCYSKGEPHPAGAHRSVMNRRPMMVRRQEAGHWYSLSGTSLDDGTLHGVSSGSEGRLSITFRFDVL